MSFVTRKQVQTVQIARRQLQKQSNGAFDDSSYQTALRNCGVAEDAEGRCSSKRLTQAGFEKLMAIFEGMGFRHAGGDQYWRNRNAERTGFATSRQVWEIKRLVEMAPDPRYPLYALCRRASNDEHSEPEKLTFRQAHCLIEAIKSVNTRMAGV